MGEREEEEGEGTWRVWGDGWEEGEWEESERWVWVDDGILLDQTMEMAAVTKGEGRRVRRRLGSEGSEG